MGFAKLVFKCDGTETMNNVLTDVFNTLSGAVTNTSGLVTANQNSSYIYNSAGRGNWSIDAGTTLPRVLRAVCLNGQNKYIQIGQVGFGREITSTTTSTPYRYLVTGTISLEAGIAMRSCTAFSSAVTVSNPSWLNQSGGAGSQQPFYTRIVGTEVYLSWSLRHCLIAGSQLGGNDRSSYSITGCFEYNEDGINDNQNTAPFCQLQGFSSVDTAVIPTTFVSTTGGPSTFTVMNHYRPDTSTTTGARNIYGSSELPVSINYHSVYPVSSTFRPGIMTKTASGASAMYLQPLYWHQHQMGIPHRYISDLCKVYVARLSPGEAGDTITVGNDTYVYIPWPNGGKGIVCLRA